MTSPLLRAFCFQLLTPLASAAPSADCRVEDQRPVAESLIDVDVMLPAASNARAVMVTSPLNLFAFSLNEWEPTCRCSSACR